MQIKSGCEINHIAAQLAYSERQTQDLYRDQENAHDRHPRPHRLALDRFFALP